MQLLFSAALLGLLLLTEAQLIHATDFVEKRFVNAQGENMRYLLFIPNKYDKQKKYPLVLWLHGGGARGDSLKLILSWGDKHGPLFFARADNQSAYPCFILAPQCPLGKFWAIIARRPNTFAAAVPICGGGNPAKAALMKNTSIWAFHGDVDNLVDVKESRRMIEAIERVGGKPKYTEYKGVGHNAWERAFTEPDFLSWIFSQRMQ